MDSKKVVGIILTVIGIIVTVFGLFLSFYPVDVFMLGGPIIPFESNPRILVVPVIGIIILIVGVFLLIQNRK